MTVLRGAPVTAAGCIVLLDGWLANRREIALAEGLGGDVRSEELIAHAYRRHGAALPSHVLGEYAAAIYDASQRRLFLTHDALGIRPAFHAADGQWFASDLAALVAATGTGEIDETYVASFLAGAEDRGDRTAYRHLRRLRQGFGIAVAGGRIRELRGFDPADTPPVRLASPEAYEEAFRAVAGEAVEAALPERGRIWCELSGGLDSSTLSVLADGRPGRTIESFSIVFSRSSRADETHWIETLLAACPLVSHRLDADSVPPFQGLPDRFLAEPTGGALIWDFDAARRAMLREHRVDTVLTGMAGDAVFCGDLPEPYFLADIVNPAHLLRALREWREGSPQRRSLGHWFHRYALRPRLRPPAARPPPLWLGRAFSASWRAAAQRRLDPRLPHGDSYYWDRVIRGALLVRDGQTFAGDAPDYRNPWLHLPLVRFMAGTPWAEKLQPDIDRTLQRRAMRGRLPEAIRLRRDKGVPAQAFFDGLARSPEWLDLLLDRPQLVERGYVEAKAWRETVALARHGCPPAPGDFIQACILEAWFTALRHAPSEATPGPAGPG